MAAEVGSRTVSEIEDVYTFLTETLWYNDGPTQGHLRNNETAELFAFRVAALQRGLWEWVLVPVDHQGIEFDEVLKKGNAIGRWVSMLEDSRAAGAEVVIITEMAGPSFPLYWDI